MNGTFAYFKVLGTFSYGAIIINYVNGKLFFSFFHIFPQLLSVVKKYDKIWHNMPKNKKIPLKSLRDIF